MMAEEISIPTAKILTTTDLFAKENTTNPNSPP
jgi:hypothetical protein